MSLSNSNGINGADSIALSIVKFTNELSKFSSFEPSPSLDIVLGDISHLCHRTEVSPDVEETILNNQEVTAILPTLRDLWGKAAGELEDHWASKIINVGSPESARKLLETYPRIQNYRKTIPIELGIISIAHGSFPSAVAMIGSGPLPLTSISIVDAATEKGHSIQVLNIDIIPERIRDSEKIFNLLGPKYGTVSHYVSDAGGALPDLSEYDAVYVASLVGNSDDEKIEILKNTARHMRKGALVVVRSSVGLSRLLWPCLQKTHFSKMEDVLQPVLAAQPLDGPTKHSVLLLRVVG